MAAINEARDVPHVLGGERPIKPGQAEGSVETPKLPLPVAADATGQLSQEVRYGTSDYCRLDDTFPNADKIPKGGEHRGEMGVYYHLFDLVRTTILQKRLDEYVPIGVEARVFFVT